jgi:DNA-binding CsgD family transcriptional regulator
VTAFAGEAGLRRILAVVDLLIQAVDEDALLPALLPALLGTIPADSVVWTTRPGPPPPLSYPASLLTADDHAVVDRYRMADPLVRHTTRGPGFPLRRSDLQSLAEWHNLPTYTDVCRRVGGEFQLAMEIPAGSAAQGRRSVCIALNRSSRDFSDDDLAAAVLLRSWLTHALIRLAPESPVLPTPGLGVPGTGTATATPREAAVLDLLVLGLTDQQISRRLGISPRTVDKHLEHAYAKFAVHGRVEAANVWLARRTIGSATPRE